MKLWIALIFMLLGSWLTLLGIAIWQHFPGETGTHLFVWGVVLLLFLIPALLSFEDMV